MDIRKENVVDVLRAIMAENLLNPTNGAAVEHDDVLRYLKEWPPRPDNVDRVAHFKLWLAGELPYNHTQH